MKAAAAAVLISISLAASASAADKLTVGVFLPTASSDGQERLRFAESFAAGLGEALGIPATGKNFGRYEDFAKAVKDGSLDVAVVDAWAAAQGSAGLRPVALAVQGGQTHRRWAIIGRGKVPLKDLAGKRLALSRGVSALDAKFINNAILVGDFEASKRLKLIPVPSVESALSLVDSKGAEAALVPASLTPKNLTTLYQSPKIPIAVAVVLKGEVEPLQQAIVAKGGVAPFDKFVAARPGELDELARLISAGPGKRRPYMAESPIVHPDAPALLNFREVGLVLPSFLDSYEVTKEQPDD